jgi:REP element-mobilizing transposase RayT
MTRPRIVDPGATLALSRRTTRRHFLLHPDEAREMEQVYWYCLAYAAKLHGVLVHAACLMSTHCHEVITDVRGEYPKFLETLHRNLALCTKAYRGWPEEVFNKRSTGVHALLTPEAMVESIAYLIANPVEAGAVRYAKDWPEAIELRLRSYEVFGSLDPQFAAAGNRAAATEAVKRLRAFKAQYVRALAAWTAGDRSACFPQGTWWMRVCHGARCGPGP